MKDKPLRVNAWASTWENAHLLTEWFPKLPLADALHILHNALDKSEEHGFSSSLQLVARQLMLMDYLRKRTSAEIQTIVSNLV